MGQALKYAAAKNDAFAGWLRETLHKRRMRPADLARAMSTQNSTVSRWLAGSVPHAHTVERLEKVLSEKCPFICLDPSVIATSVIQEPPPPDSPPPGPGSSDGEILHFALTTLPSELLAKVVDAAIDKASPSVPKSILWLKRVMAEVSRRGIQPVT